MCLLRECCSLIAHDLYNITALCAVICLLGYFSVVVKVNSKMQYIVHFIHRTVRFFVGVLIYGALWLFTFCRQKLSTFLL